MIFICFTTVDFPPSPPPGPKLELHDLTLQIEHTQYKNLSFLLETYSVSDDFLVDGFRSLCSLFLVCCNFAQVIELTVVVRELIIVGAVFEELAQGVSVGPQHFSYSKVLLGRV